LTGSRDYMKIFYCAEKYLYSITLWLKYQNNHVAIFVIKKIICRSLQNDFLEEKSEIKICSEISFDLIAIAVEMQKILFIMMFEKSNCKIWLCNEFHNFAKVSKMAKYLFYEIKYDKIWHVFASRVSWLVTRVLMSSINIRYFVDTYIVNVIIAYFLFKATTIIIRKY